MTEESVTLKAIAMPFCALRAQGALNCMLFVRNRDDNSLSQPAADSSLREGACKAYCDSKRLPL